MTPVLTLARPDILQLQPYQHAAWDPSLERMHANEIAQAERLSFKTRQSHAPVTCDDFL